MSDALINKYRPKRLEDVLGQEAVAASLKSVLAAGNARAFLFVGMPGVGKTTLARIMAEQLGCGNVLEIDAATNSGADDMRAVAESMRYAGIGAKSGKMVIVDEVAYLSKQAWAALLKIVEEPGKNYWVFCTSDPGKVPEAIETRCLKYNLKPVRKTEVFDLLARITKLEKYDTPNDVLYLFAEECQGSVRRSLSYLAQGYECRTRAEAAELVRSFECEKDVADLCNAISKNAGWADLMKIVKGLGETQPESVRMKVLGWFTKAALDSKSVDRAERVLAILDAFAYPYPQGGTVANLILSLGRLYMR